MTMVSSNRWHGHIKEPNELMLGVQHMRLCASFIRTLVYDHASAYVNEGCKPSLVAPVASNRALNRRLSSSLP
jgi:hypothetical protein